MLIILVFTGFNGRIKASSDNLLSRHGYAIKDSLNLHDTIPNVFEPIEFLPSENDTLLLDETSEAATDTLDTDSPRQTGSGVILDAKVDYSAKDSIRFDIRNQIVHLYGEADLKYGSIHLEAAYVNIDFKKNELFAQGVPDSLGQLTGNPVFTDADQSFESLEIRYNFQTRKGRTTKVMTEEADGYMHGEVVKMMSDKVIHVRDGKYTTCDNPEPHFHISFRKAKIIPNDKIISSLAFLTIEGVRTPLFLPFGFFPNTRGQASGILIPSYGEERNRGFNLRNGGFYWGINDYLDLSITGDIYSRGSWATTVGSTYRKRYKYSGNFNVNYAINIFGERGLPDYQRSRDFRVVWSHSQDPKARPNSVFRANVNAGSSQNNRFNPVSDRDYLSNTLSSSISYSANWAGRYNFSANLRHSQNTQTQMVDLTLPEIAFSVNRFYPLRRSNPQGPLRWYEDITMNYTMNASNQISSPDSLLFDSQVFSQMKNGIQHAIPISHSMRLLSHFNLSNSISYNERWYFEHIEKRWEEDPDDPGFNPETGRYAGQVVNDTINRFTPIRDFSYSTSLNTKIYGMMQFSRGPVTAVRHVVTPNLGFSLRPDFADPFWGYYQYYENPNMDDPQRYAIFEGSRYGGPGPGRSGSLNFSVTNNLEMKVRGRGEDEEPKERKIALIDNLSMSANYNFAADSMKLSNLSLSGRTRLFGQFDITYGSRWSPYATDSLGNPYDKYLWEEGEKIFRMENTDWRTSFNYNLSSKTKAQTNERADQMTNDRQAHGDLPFGTENGVEEDEDAQPRETLPDTPKGMIDYTVPWSLRFSYSLSHGTRLTRPELEKDRSFSQSLTFSGDISLTPNWRIGFSSGYNFDENTITYTSLNIYRDLHCWELMINWIPFGFRQSYNMTLRVKSNVLQDLKLERRTHHLDRIPF